MLESLLVSGNLRAQGYLTTALGIKMKVEETKCTAKGDPNCTFEAKPEKYAELEKPLMNRKGFRKSLTGQSLV